MNQMWDLGRPFPALDLSFLLCEWGDREGVV